MLVPKFEIKDSYILKNKIGYDTTSTELSGLTYGILFTDYDLARKTQSSNAENFENIIISGNTSIYNTISMIYNDNKYVITLDDYVMCESGVTTSTLVNNRNYQSYLVDNIYLYSVGDYLEINFYQNNLSTGTTMWYSDGEIGDTWYVSGLTSNNNQWEKTGIINDSEPSGITSWILLEKIPILEYNCFIKSTGLTHINVEKKLEDYLFNNLQSSSKYPNLFYKIKNLNHCQNNYIDISNYLKSSTYGVYLDPNFSDNYTKLHISALKNQYDIYFDYSNFQIVFSGSSSIVYQFHTNNLYNKYTLENFLNQFTIPNSHSIYTQYSAVTSSLPYVKNLEFDITLTNSGDTQYFTEYTFINIETDQNNSYKCVLKSISGTTFTIITPPNLIVGEIINKINNLYNVKDISDMLFECYLNIQTIT